MTGRQKKLQVLEDIRQESEISPNPILIEFKFSNNIANGVLDIDEKKIILKRLEKEGVIKIKDNKKYNEVSIKILPPFYNKYYLYRLTSLDNNAWNIVNPFWILWQLITIIWNKNKIITTMLGTLVLFLAYDYSQAWKNIDFILIFLKLK